MSDPLGMKWATFALTLGAVSALACAPKPRVDATVLQHGGTFDASVCGAGVAAPVSIFPRRPAAQAMRFGVCGALTANNTLTVQGSTRVQSDLHLAAPVEIGNDLFVGGNIEGANTLTVRNDLTGAGNWQVSAPAQVEGDVTLSGTLRHDNTVSVNGTCRVGAESGSGALHAGSLQVTTTQVSAPLDCAAPLDVHTLAGDVAQHGDARALAALEPGALATVHQPVDLTLGCGRYELSSLETQNTLTLRIVGPTVIAVHGRAHIASPTTVTLAPGASLEWVIDGALDVDNTLTVGSVAQPASVLVAGEVRVRSPVKVYGVLVAPRSALGIDNTLDVFGSVFAGDTRVASPFNVHEGPSLGVEGFQLAD